MTITPESDGRVHFRCVLVFEETRPSVSLLDTHSERDVSAQPVALCSWCGRAQHGSRWLEIEELVLAATANLPTSLTDPSSRSGPLGATRTSSGTEVDPVDLEAEGTVDPVAVEQPHTGDQVFAKGQVVDGPTEDRWGQFVERNRDGLPLSGSGKLELVSVGDIDAYIEVHDPAFVMRDHRRLGWGDMDLDACRAWLESIAMVDRDTLLFHERFLRVDPTSSSCSAQRLVFTAPEGTTDLLPSIALIVVDPESGLVTGMELFDADQADDAVARFDELMAEREPVLANQASQRWAFVNEWLRRGEDEWIAAAIAPDAELIDENGQPFELHPVGRRRVMAVRGDRLAMVELIDEPSGFRRIAVEEINEGGQLCAVTLFDVQHVDAAATRFEELSAGMAGPERELRTAADRLARDLCDRYFAGGDWGSLLAPDFITVDHSPVVGYSRRGVDEGVQLWPDPVACGRLTATIESVALRGNSLAVHRISAVTADGGAEWDSYLLTRWDERGQAALGARFPIEMRAEAIAELDRLWLGDSADTSPGEFG